MNIEELKELINNINNQQDANSIADDIVKQFAYNTGIDLNDYVYPSEEAPSGGETDEQV